mmetsp:Transcript_33367/g.57158  ORF Transcript_33367/g.57158 Transcript_33367/m.57158 type:complete len:265 (-) Transcript_33367:115-909(-)
MPTMFIMNPKGFGHRLLEHVVRAFPLQTADAAAADAEPWPLRHVFMYRACTKVVESFGSIFSAGGKGKGPPKPPPGGRPKPTFASEAMKEAVANGTLAPEPGRPMATHLTSSWMDCMLHWMEITGRSGARAAASLGQQERRELRQYRGGPIVKGRDQLEEDSQLTLRMEEFVTKDLAKRETLVKEILSFVSHGQGMVPSELGAAMAAFGSHSQKGSQMEKSSAVTGAKFLDEGAVTQVEAYVGSVPNLAAVGGSNAILSGSMGR